MNELLKKPRVYEKAQANGMRIVRIEPSYICNLHCKHCCVREFQSKQGRSMTIQDIQSISMQADELGFAQFVISGGEPLIYPNFDEIVKAIDPQKFYITTDTNGWCLDWKRAKHLKSIGVDKVQVSIDSLDRETHDKFRGREGSWELAINAIRNCKQVGLRVIVQTVIDKHRVHSQELIDFIEYFNAWNVPVCVLYAKPVGAWKDNLDVVVTQDDINYVEGLATKYKLFSHLTDGYCIAMRRMINITKFGDLNPCPVMQEYSIGNIFNEQLKDIVARGTIEFGERVPTCMMATDRDYVQRKNEIRSA